MAESEKASRSLRILFQGSSSLPEVEQRWDLLTSERREALSWWLIPVGGLVAQLHDALAKVEQLPHSSFDPSSRSDGSDAALASVSAQMMLFRAIDAAEQAMGERVEQMRENRRHLQSTARRDLDPVRRVAGEGVGQWPGPGHASNDVPEIEDPELKAMAMEVLALGSAARKGVAESASRIEVLLGWHYRLVAALLELTEQVTMHRMRQLRSIDRMRRLEAWTLDLLVGFFVVGVGAGSVLGWIQARWLLVGLVLALVWYFVARRFVLAPLLRLLTLRRIRYLRSSIAALVDDHRDQFRLSLELLMMR